MKNIEDSVKERNLSEAIRLRKQLKEAHVGDKEIETRLFKLRHKEFSAAFKSYSRDQRDEFLADKTNAPPVGQYNPMFFSGQHSDRTVVIHKPGTNFDQALERKMNVYMTQT